MISRKNTDGLQGAHNRYAQWNMTPSRNQPAEEFKRAQKRDWGSAASQSTLEELKTAEPQTSDQASGPIRVKVVIGRCYSSKTEYKHVYAYLNPVRCVIFSVTSPLLSVPYCNTAAMGDSDFPR